MDIFILGAKDPEMDAIEEILQNLNVLYYYGLVGGVRCNRTNSYNLDSINEKNVILVECDFENKEKLYIKCDHHHEVDAGFHLNYNHFLEASSIGQVLQLLLEEDLVDVASILDFPLYLSSEEGYYFKDGYWFFGKNGVSAQISKKIVLIAATDHCPGDMYKNLCKGVDSLSMFEDRIHCISKSFSYTLDFIFNIVREYEEMILDLFEGDILDLTHLELGIGYSLNYLVLREVSLKENIPIAVRTVTDDISKVMMLGLSSNQVENVLQSQEFNSIYLKNVFGVPSRGYAGGEIA